MPNFDGENFDSFNFDTGNEPKTFTVDAILIIQDALNDLIPIASYFPFQGPISVRTLS